MFQHISWRMRLPNNDALPPLIVIIIIISIIIVVAFFPRHKIMIIVINFMTTIVNINFIIFRND